MEKEVAMIDYVDQELYERFSFRCAYCGFDGRPFENWLLLEIDHINPSSKGGTDEDQNKVVCCHPCNRSTNHYSPTQGATREQMINEMIAHIRDRREAYLELWKRSVVPRWLEVPLDPAPAS